MTVSSERLDDGSITVNGTIGRSLIDQGLVLFHGWKSDNSDLLAFAKKLVRASGEKLAILLPRAPFAVDGCEETRSWFHVDENSPPDSWRPEWTPIQAAILSCETFSQKMGLRERGRGLVLGGFSQGAIFASHVPGYQKYLILSSAPLKRYVNAECMFVHGEKDAIFPFREVQEMVFEQLSHRGHSKRHSLIQHPGEHNLDGLEDEQIVRICTFVLGYKPERLDEVTNGGDSGTAGENEVKQDIIDALKVPTSSMFDDILHEPLWGCADSSLLDDWERAATINNGNNGAILVLHGTDVSHAVLLAEKYAAATNHRVILPAYEQRLSAIASMVAEKSGKEWEHVNFVHGIGAGSIVAVHLAAWRTANGNPLRGIVLESPVGRLQELGGMKSNFFGCVSEDPLQHAQKLEVVCTHSQTPVLVVAGSDRVFTRKGMLTIRKGLQKRNYMETKEAISTTGLLVDEITGLLCDG